MIVCVPLDKLECIDKRANVRHFPTGNLVCLQWKKLKNSVRLEVWLRRS